MAAWLDGHGQAARRGVFALTLNGAERSGLTSAPLWFDVDELDARGRIDDPKDASARLRKCGGRRVLGFQSIAQVRDTYGDTEVQTIVENCGNTLILRCSASQGGGIARFVSKLIGDRELDRIAPAMEYGANVATS